MSIITCTYQYGRHLFDNLYAWLKSQIQINPYQPKYLRILHSHRVGWCQIVKYQHRQVRWFPMLSQDSLLWGQLSEEIPLKCIALTASYIFKHRPRQSRELLVCYHYVILLLFNNWRKLQNDILLFNKINIFLIDRLEMVWNIVLCWVSLHL